MGVFLGVIVVLCILLIAMWVSAVTVDSFMYTVTARSWILLAISLVIWAAIISAVILAAKRQTESGPCVTYQTQMHYNPATKTMMPAKVCVNRGEWVDER